MTRETKIGLLVGLAFIIVIGVLLSDHIQSATEPQRATLTGASDALHRAVSSPGPALPSSAVVVAPNEVAPNSPVATQESLTLAERPTPSITIGPGNDATPAGERLAAGTPSQPDEIVIDTGHNAGATSMPMQAAAPVIMTTGQADRDLLAKAATGRDPAATTNGATSPAPVAMKSYKAVEGDTIYKIAKKFYGSYTKTREELIVKANPQMGGRADRISVGKTYMIPAEASATPTPNPAAPTPATPAPTPSPAMANAKQTTPVSTPKPGSMKLYTVKDGDSLWKIASAQGHSVAELKTLNKDVLKGSDIVQPGMKLKIPVNQVASAN